MMPKVDWEGGYANKFLSKKLSESTFYEMYSSYLELPKEMSALNLEIFVKDYNTYPASNGLLLQKTIENISYFSWIYTFVFFVILNSINLKKN